MCRQYSECFPIYGDCFWMCDLPVHAVFAREDECIFDTDLCAVYLI